MLKKNCEVLKWILEKRCKNLQTITVRNEAIRENIGVTQFWKKIGIC
jgi:hypothetical protein